MGETSWLKFAKLLLPSRKWTMKEKLNSFSSIIGQDDVDQTDEIVAAEAIASKVLFEWRFGHWWQKQ